jgi:uncharacterized protein (TIGR02246 family)
MVTKIASQWFAVSAVTICVAFQANQAWAQSHASADDVLADWKQAVAAFSAAKDPEAAVDIYMAIHTPDAVLMFPGMPPVLGAKEIRSFIQGWCRGYRFEIVGFRTDDLIVREDVAIHRYSGTAVITPRAGGEPRRDSRKYVDVLRRGADGRWRTAIHIFNKNE